MTLTTTISRCRSLSSSVSSFSNDVFRRLSSSSSSCTKTIPSSEGRSIDDYAEKERRMCSRNSRASTSGRRTSLNTNNIKNKNINRRMFASDASPFVSSTIGETKKKKKKKSKNAAASTASLSAESSNEDEETEDENENDSEDVNENKEDKSSRLAFTTSENDDDTFRGNKAGRLSTQAISKRGGGQEGAAGKESRTSFYKPMTSRAQIDGMNCEQHKPQTQKSKHQS